MLTLMLQMLRLCCLVTISFVGTDRLSESAVVSSFFHSNSCFLNVSKIGPLAIPMNLS